MTGRFQPSEIALLDQMAAGRNDMFRTLQALCRKRPDLAAEALIYLSVKTATTAMESPDGAELIEKLFAVGNPVLSAALKAGARHIASVLTESKENPDA